MPNLPTHPHWCASRDQCADRGTHRGRLVEIRALDGEHAPVTLQLIQSLAAGEPYIVVTGSVGHVVLSIRQARAMAYATVLQARHGSNPGAYPARRWRGPFRGQPR
jgi:hypothetical protein